MQTHNSFSYEQTKDIAKNFAASVKPGDTVCVDGEMGVGKTAFVTGLCAGLGFFGYVTSPTFTIVNEYDGKVKIFHFDTYRLNDEDDLFDIGFDDYLVQCGVCIIEWSSRVRAAIPPGAHYVEIAKDMQKGEDYRCITIESETTEPL